MYMKPNWMCKAFVLYFKFQIYCLCFIHIFYVTGKPVFLPVRTIFNVHK
jgi:hypothetical protein